MIKWLIILLASTSFAAEWYVATNGDAGNPGTISSPITIAKSFSSTSPANPGDTVWIRGGTYAGPFTNACSGLSGQPITWRNYNKERATLDGVVTNGYGVITANSSWGIYWGLELLNSQTNRRVSGLSGVYDFGVNNKWISMIVHDNTGNGFVAGINATNAEISGCVIYNNGYQGESPDRGHGHGIYLQGWGGTKTIYGNICHHQMGYGIHGYSETGHMEGQAATNNVCFRNGMITADSFQEVNFEMGGLSDVVPCRRIWAVSNYTYHYRLDQSDNVYFGYGFATNEDLLCTGNYFAGGRCYWRYWTNGIVTNNWVVNDNGASISVKDGWLGERYVAFDRNRYWMTRGNGDGFHGPFFYWDTNQYTFQEWTNATAYDVNSTFYNTMPTTNNVFLIDDHYEPNRGIVVIYNWAGNDNVSVDISPLVSVNTIFRVVNAQDYYGPTVLTLTNTGAAVSFPMTNLGISTPTGIPVTVPTNSGPWFEAFILEPIGSIQRTLTARTSTIGSVTNWHSP